VQAVHYVRPIPATQECMASTVLMTGTSLFQGHSNRMLRLPAPTSKCCCCPSQARVEQVVSQQVHVQQAVVPGHCQCVPARQQVSLDSLQGRSTALRPLTFSVAVHSCCTVAWCELH
jgi:hypothetical protein